MHHSTSRGNRYLPNLSQRICKGLVEPSGNNRRYSFVFHFVLISLGKAWIRFWTQGKIEEKIWLSAATIKEKLEFKLAVLQLKSDFIWILACDDGRVGLICEVDWVLTMNTMIDQLNKSSGIFLCRLLCWHKTTKQKVISDLTMRQTLAGLAICLSVFERYSK